MNEFNPKDGIIPAPHERHSGRMRKSGSNHDQDPQINMDELDLEPVPQSAPRASASSGNPSQDKISAESPAGQRKLRGQTFSRQHMIMGTGILILLLVIFFLAMTSHKSTPDNTQSSDEKNIDLATLSTDNADSTTPVHTGRSEHQQLNTQPLAQNGTLPRSEALQPNIAAPVIAGSPIQDNPASTTTTQPRLTIQDRLNNALITRKTEDNSQPISSNQSASPLPTAPASLAPGGTRPPVSNNLATGSQSGSATVVARPLQPADSKHSDTTTGSTRHTRRENSNLPPQSGVPVAKPVTASTPVTINALKAASGNYYTLQLSGASNDKSLKNWAQKEQLKNYVVYKTSRNGQPWYVLVSGIYPSRNAAKLAITTLPARIQAKDPWVKPLHLVQDDLKQ